MFEFTKLSNIIRIRFTVKINFKMPKQGRQTNKENPLKIVYLSVVFLAGYFPFFPCTILYMITTTEISFLVSQFASEFLIYLNSSLNPLPHWGRYREIRQIVKSTIKKILRLDENMTWGCEVLRDEIWRERAILEGNWDELTFAKTSGTVTRDKGKMTKNDRADGRLPTWVTIPEKIAGNISALILSKVANGLAVLKEQGKV